MDTIPLATPIYILGTGLSHDGSSCLLKDGKIVVAIEKERLSRRKHDGGNDLLTVQYCLDYAGITVDDLSLVVQSAHFEKEFIQKDRYSGQRLFPADCTVPFVTISHHLAHAYSAIGTCPFDTCNVMVIDGSGSFYEQCDDLADAFIPEDINSEPGAYAETNSFYYYDGLNLHSIFKDFGVIRYDHGEQEAFLPTARNSIGGLYATASNYCFGDFNQAGKLMGLAPFGKRDIYEDDLFILNDGRVRVRNDIVQKFFTNPAADVNAFNTQFQYYADIARWVQEQAEKAILYLFTERLSSHPHDNMVYAGGVALNAVTNSRLLQLPVIKQLYIEPAAGDNGLAIGCAYYGWLNVLKQKKVIHSGTTLLGKPYNDDIIRDAISTWIAEENNITVNKDGQYIKTTAAFLAAGKTIAWFQSGSEFGPRALGRRSILADPRLPHIQQHINREIKLREDFRPFAPAVLYEDRHEYFELGLESPYMILIDRIKKEWEDKMPGVVHVDGTCRVQTVRDKNEPFYQLLQAFKSLTGISVLLNTSQNRRKMPIVESPADAIQFFCESKLDVLVINDFIFTK